MKTHGENVQQRESRVHRYGHATGLLGLRNEGEDSGQPTYAMFSKRVTRGVNANNTSGNNELRRRHGQGLNSEPKYHAASPYPENANQPPQDPAENAKQLHQQRLKHSKSRQGAAVQVEKSVAEVSPFQISLMSSRTVFSLRL
jgi:hypothetical protein